MIKDLISTTKAGLSEESAALVASLIAEAVREGELYAHEALGLSKWLETIASNIKKHEETAEAAEQELIQNGGGLSAHSVGYSLKPSVRYDYKNSEAWAELQKDFEPLKEAQKEIETIAKSISTASRWVHPGTGEELEVKPAHRRESTSVTVKLPAKIEIEYSETDLPFEA